MAKNPSPLALSIIDGFRRGLRPLQIMQETGCSQAYTGRWRRKLGIEPFPSGLPRHRHYAEIVAMLKCGASNPEIIAKFNVPPDVISRCRKHAGLPANKRGRQLWSVVDTAKLEAVCILSNGGMTMTAIASVFKMSRQQVDGMLNNGKRICRYLTTRAISAGVLVRPSVCSNCGQSKFPDAHHDDYSKPLQVQWLCRACHIAHHRFKAVLPTPAPYSLKSSP